MLICHAFILCVTLWIFHSTLKLDIKKPGLLTTLIRQRALAKLKLDVKLKRSLQTVKNILPAIKIPEPANSTPGI
jgi:hypothetical protein